MRCFSAAEDNDPMAPRGFAPVLTVEVSTWPTAASIKLRGLIRRIVRENPVWGEERIAA